MVIYQQKSRRKSKTIQSNSKWGNPKKNQQKDAIERIRVLYDSRQKIINLFNDYAKIISEAMQKTKQRRELKILTPKQMHQRLPIALAQAKAGNILENLLNETRQIVSYLYQSKTKN